MTQINYYSLLREKIMEDSECREDLMEVRMGTKIKYYDEIEDENIGAIVLENLNGNIVNTDAGTFSIHRIKEVIGNDLTINHILAYCGNEGILCSITEMGCLEIGPHKGIKAKKVVLDFLKSLSEQQEACLQILDFLNK